MLVRLGQKGRSVGYVGKAGRVGGRVDATHLGAIAVTPTSSTADGSLDRSGRCELRDEVHGKRGAFDRDAAGVHECQLVVGEPESPGQRRDRSERNGSKARVLLQGADRVDDGVAESASPPSWPAVSVNELHLSVSGIEDMLEQDVAVTEVRIQRRWAGLDSFGNVTKRNTINASLADQHQRRINDRLSRERSLRRPPSPDRRLLGL